MGGKDDAGNKSTSEGIGGEFLKMPVSYIGKDDEGSTGMLFSNVMRHSKNAVADYVLKQAKTYGPYEIKKWDCEDYAFLAASEVRCKFLGQPVAIALGKAKEDASMAGQNHALLVLWFGNQVGGELKWDSFYFDPTLKRFVDFDTQIIIPLPFSGFIKGNQDLPFKKKLPFLETAAFALDGRDYNYTLIDDVMKTLTSDGISECPMVEGRSPEELALLKDPEHRYWSPIDRQFWYFAHMRRKHKGAPVGFAVGTAIREKKPPFPFSALVLWKKPDEFFYWDIGVNKKLSDFKVKTEFNPRIVFV